MGKPDFGNVRMISLNIFQTNKIFILSEKGKRFSNLPFCQLKSLQ